MKQTEIGLIPEDWEYVDAEKFIDFITGFPFKSQLFSSTGIKLLRGSNVKRNYIDWNEDITKFWNIIDSKMKDYYLAEGDIVISMDGSLVGRSFGQISRSDLPALLVQRVARIRGKSASTNFLKHLYCSEFFTKHCDNNKTASAIPHISPKDIKEYKILLPQSLPEQEAIATALSDADAWIESLERLIAKKRLIKQGAMQELLSPKEDWEVKKLGEVCQNDGLIRGPFGGALKKDFFVKKGFKVYEQKNAIYKSVNLGIYYIDYNKFKELLRFEIRENDFILSCSGTIGKLYRIPRIFEKGIINQALLIIRLNGSLVNLTFFNHIFQYDPIQAKIIDDTQGGAMKNLVGMSEFKNTEIPLPPLTEQTRIATILSDMDTEIEALEAQLDKARQIKQGMMQELLTGRIRLL